MASGTVRFHRVLTAKPERVYKAFLDADAMAKWLPPFGFTGKVHSIDARVGGSYHVSFTNFSSGHTHSFGGTYRELEPGMAFSVEPGIYPGPHGARIEDIVVCTADGVERLNHTLRELVVVA